MKKMVAIALVCMLLIGILPVSALAARAYISLGGKVGFMYEDMSVTLKPGLKNVSADDLSWNSSDASVATVSNGRITSLKEGRTVISVSGGGASARCGVVVLPKSVDVEAGDMVSLPHGTVEKYAVQDSSIAKINSKGVICGVRQGTTYVRVRYGKQTLYVQVKVSGGEEIAEQSAAAKLDCAKETNQIVLVEHESGSKATLSVHEKKNGVWTEIYSCPAAVGKNGIGKTREGDKKTPTGTYNLTQPFGIKADPGANMNYTQVTKYHYWCGTSGSEYYNQLVDMRETNRKYTSSDEYLINYKGVYNYCMFIDYNRNGTAGKGSCIFLHCSDSRGYTAGCIAVNESAMKKIIQWAEPGAKIVIR